MARSSLLALPFLLCLAGCGGDEEGSKAPSAPAANRTTKQARAVPPDEIRGEATWAFRPAPAGATPVRGDTAVIAFLQDIDSLNPFLSSSVSASEVQDLIFPRLMHEQPDYNEHPPTFAPQLAESWTFGEDGLSIRFKLRDCTWSDGTPVTADDVRFSWEAARDPSVAWVSASIVDFIKDVEVHSPREFTVRYSMSYPYQLMDINDVQILPKHAFGKIPFSQWSGYGKWLDEARISGGPWRLEDYKPGQEITLGRNPKYWEEGKPYLERIVIRIFGDQGSMLTSLLAGQVDVMESVIPKDAKRVLEASGLNLYTYVTRSYGYVGWNCKRWPFDDRRVRQAMTYAIDRSNIVESLFYGYADVAGPPIITSMWASDRDIEPYPFSPERAEALLEEAGFKKGGDGTYAKDGRPLSFVLVTNQGNEVRKSICEYIQSNLREIGVKVEIRLMDFNQMSAQLKRHDFQAYVGGWYVATKVDNKPTFHSTSVEGRYNYVNYTNPRVDEIIDTARLMADFTKAKPLWDEFQKILNEDQPYTMVYEPRGLVGIAKRFVNVKVTSLRAYDNIEAWWVPEAEQKYKN